MQIKWIDFSNEDKSNAISVINSLNELGVLDELGFGVLRNAFANDFFPGTSTLHTRSKYLYLIPYMLYDFQKQCADGKILANGKAPAFIKNLKEKIDKEELATKNILMEDKDNLDGVIGSSKNDKSYWVERTPIIIYWTGLRTFGFFENNKFSENLTYNEVLADFYRIAKNKTNSKNAATEKESEDSNDLDAGGSVFYPISKDFNRPNWKQEIKIDLTKDEATDFKKRIIESDGSKNSLFAHILKENLIPDADIEMDFESFVSLIKNKVPTEYKHKLEMAVSLNNFYYLVMLRYNYLLCNGQSEKKNFISKWQEIEKQIIPYCENFNPAELFQTMKIQNKKLFDFLFGIKNDFIEATKTGDFSKVDQRITDRESKLKTTRAKIGHPDKYDVNNLLEYVRFDYRLGTARQHIKDIQEGLKNA